jgi:hypothetical protein
LALLGQDGIRAVRAASLTPACRRRRARRASLADSFSGPAAPDVERYALGRPSMVVSMRIEKT